MAIFINKDNPKESIWPFYIEWLTLLRSPHPEIAFKFIDGSSPDGYQWNAKSFQEFLQKFSGDLNETYDFSDILIEGPEVEDCKSDSTITKHTDGSYYALLDLPLKTTKPFAHSLVLGFYFTPQADGLYKALLHIDSNVVII